AVADLRGLFAGGGLAGLVDLGAQRVAEGAGRLAGLFQGQAQRLLYDILLRRAGRRDGVGALDGRLWKAIETDDHGLRSLQASTVYRPSRRKVDSFLRNEKGPRSEEHTSEVQL